MVFQGNLWVFVRSKNSSDIYRNIFDGVFWSGWGKVPIPAAMAPIEPEATVYDGRIWLFTRDIEHSDGSLYRITYNGSSWGGWQGIGGQS